MTWNKKNSTLHNSSGNIYQGKYVLVPNRILSVSSDVILVTNKSMVKVWEYNQVR